jgi:hypothetical protein
MSYPDVSITNSTPYTIRGTVFYMACENDGFTDLHPGRSRSFSRGFCLITSIYATIETPQGDVAAEPYQSTGTSYSEFAVTVNREGKYVVTRITTMHQEQEPEHVASTEGTR